MSMKSVARGAMTAIVAAALSATASAALAAGPACLNVPKAKVGLQLYSLLGELRPPGASPAAGAARPPVDTARLDRIYGNLSAIGWKNIENFDGDWTMGEAGYKKMVEGHGMKIVASHDNTDDVTFTAAIQRAKAWGQTYVGSGNYGQPGLDTLDHVLETAAHLNKLGQMAAAQGLKFYVHNHQTEFKNTFSYDLNGDGRPETVSAWEIVAAKTDPRYVHFEIDIHWARVAMGLDNMQELTAFLRKHRDRIVLLHIKDTTASGEITDLGKGTTDWAQIVSAAGPQIGYYLWEFDRPTDPLASARIAYDFMNCTKP